MAEEISTRRGPLLTIRPVLLQSSPWEMRSLFFVVLPGEALFPAEPGGWEEAPPVALGDAPPALTLETFAAAPAAL